MQLIKLLFYNDFKYKIINIQYKNILNIYNNKY